MEGKDSTQNSKIDIQNEVITFALIPLPPPALSKSLRSICKVDTSYQMSTGFLIKFFKGEEEFFSLMTNEHSITKELIEQRKRITIYYDSESLVKEIQLNPNQRFIKEFKTDINIDATVIEIIPKDKIENNYFLLPFWNIWIYLMN